MSIPDKLLEQFYKLLTDITDDEWRHLDKDMCSGELNPIEVKKMLARLIVERLHSREAAIREQQAFEKVFSRHALPDDMPEFAIKPGGDVKNISDLVLHCGFSSTRSEVRRLIQGGAVRSIINGEVTNLDDPFRNLPNIDSWVLNVGKRRYAKIIFKDIAAPSPQKSDPDATADNSNVVASPMSKFNHLLSHISLVDHTSSFAGLHPSLFDNQLNGGALYFGTGLCTSKAMSVGLPFDVIGMVCVAEKIRRFLGLDKIIQLIADTHAKSNSFTVDSEVDEAAQSVKATMLRVASSLGLEDVYSPILSSDFDSSDEYLSIFKKIDTNDHEYVRREWSDIEYLRQHHALRIKLSWTIGHKVKKVGFDERLYDRRFADVTGNPMSFVYLNAGRTLDKSRPKASPYICIPGERRILLRRGEDVAGKLRDAEKDFGSPSLKGAQKHLNDIVLMHEEMFGSLGDNLTLDENINRIIDKCC